MDDDDVYQCQVTLGYTSSLRSRKAKVEVLVPPQDPFIKEGRVLTVKESRDVTITCISKGGKPAAKVSMFRPRIRLGDLTWGLPSITLY